MQWNDMVRKLEGLLEELTQAAADTPAQPARVAADPEKEADRWVRKYVRSQSIALPSTEAVSLLLARATYAATFARLAPRQDAQLSTKKAAEIVEILMIDLWHGCFRKNWLKSEKSSPQEPARAIHPLVPMHSRYFQQSQQGQPGLWN